MNLELLDMYKEFPINFIFDEEAGAQQFAYDGFSIPIVVRQSLSLELLRRSVKIAGVVCEVKRCDEH